MRKKYKKKDGFDFHVILCSIVFVVLLFMTIGFANYDKLVDFSGTSILKPEGRFYIKSVTKGTHTNATSNPEIISDDQSVNFNLSFSTVANSSATYQAVFTITIVNDTFTDYVYSTINYPITINRQSNGRLLDSSYVNYTVSGLAAGDIIPSSGGEVSFTVTFTFYNPSNGQDTDTFVINGDFTPEAEEDKEVHFLVSINEPTTGDLRGDLDTAEFSLHILSTYTTNQNFNISLSSNHYKVVDANGNDLGTLSIASGGEDNYTFYVKELEGNEYTVSEERVTVYVTPLGGEEKNAGRISLLVDQNVAYSDDKAPIISNVVATIQDTEGSVLLTWKSYDDTNIDYFNIYAYESESNDPVVYKTPDDKEEYNITNLAEGKYYFVVTGTDQGRNTAMSSDISEAEVISSIENGKTACRDSDEYISYVWRFTLSFSCTSNYTCPSDSTIMRGSTISSKTISVRNTSSNYRLPQSLTVTMGEVVQSSGTDYTYNRNSNTSGTFSMTQKKVTGNVSVSVTETTGGGGCLMEGTKVMLYDGTVKNIEDIDYSDLLMIYDHKKGEISYAYPIWIEEAHTTDNYIKVEFSDNTYLEVAPSGHSIFNADLNKYVDVIDNNFKVGSRVYKIDNENNLKIVRVKSIKKVYEEKKYYNLITVGYYNFIANNFLTQESFANATNSYTFYGKKLKYGLPYYLIRIAPKLDYDYFKNTVPYHIYKGSNLENAYTMVGDNFDEDFLRKFALEEIKEPYIIDNKNAWFVTTSLDDLSNRNKYMMIQGSVYTLPNNKNIKCYYNTYDSKCYKGGDKIIVNHSLHFIAKNK